MEEEKKYFVFNDLNSFLNKPVTVKLLTGQSISGILHSYDKIPNVVIKKNEDWEYTESIICMGHSIMMICLDKKR